MFCPSLAGFVSVYCIVQLLGPSSCSLFNHQARDLVADGCSLQVLSKSSTFVHLDVVVTPCVLQAQALELSMGMSGDFEQAISMCVTVTLMAVVKGVGVFCS